MPSLEDAYREACMAIGEGVVAQRFLIAGLNEAKAALAALQEEQAPAEGEPSTNGNGHLAEEPAEPLA